jgi:outer membrane protein assembly factor BamB
LGQKGEATLNVAVHRRLAWSYETVGEIWGTARALNNGNVVFGNSNHKVYCLNPQGSLVWSFTADQQIIEAPAVDPSTNQVYVGTVGGTVYGLTANGSEYWSKSIGTPVGGDLVFSNGLVYVAGFNGSVIAMQPSNGNSQWEASLTTQVMGAPAVASDGTVYVGGQDKIMYAVQNGSVKWSIPTGGEIWSTPAVGADYTVYFGSNDGWVYALKPDGSTKWVMDVGGQIWGQPLIATDGHIIVASTSKYVTKLEPNFGVQIWTTKTEGITNSSPVQAADGTLMVGTTGGKIFAIEPEAGVVQWTYQVGNTIHATPLLLDNRAYFGSTDRNFYSLQLTPEGEGQ